MANQGFTLIELMVTIAIIGVLASIAVPRFAMLMRKSNEAATKGNLAAIRSAISIYYGDTEGQFPQDDLAVLLAGQTYLNRMPKTFVEPWHRPGNVVASGGAADLISSDADLTHWFYYRLPAEPLWGTVIVNCEHLDSKGYVWTGY